MKASSYNKSIAVIGMSARFPDAPNIATFWENIAAGKCAIREIPGTRWKGDEYYSPTPQTEGKAHSKWAGLLSDIDCFDASFFKISRREAELTDPQQRLLLEESWKAFEDAGYTPETLSNSNCGVFIGASTGDYRSNIEKHAIPLSAQVFTGTDNGILAARIAYFFNLQGPCMTIDTACSSSLTALHTACNSLIAGESEIALTGGVYTMATPDYFIMSNQLGIVSPTGKLKVFDDKADGSVPGEAVACVLLKTLAQAEADNDPIYAVIKASAVNQDGKSNGITAPNLKAQTALEKRTYKQAQITPDQITYVECHGTGTQLGDHIELKALVNAFGKQTSQKQYCALGSVKANIGHTGPASGLAGLIKVVMSLQHQQISPVPHFEVPNRYIKFEQSPFYVNTELKRWETNARQPRLAALSSYGFSGSNVHVVIEEYVAQKSGKRDDANENPVVITLSAKDATRLHEMAASLSAHLEHQTLDNIELDNVAYTLQTGRQSMRFRMAFIAKSMQECKERLDLFLGGNYAKSAIFCYDTKEELKTVEHLLKNDAGDTYLKTITVNRDLEMIAQLWTKGIGINWDKLYNEKPKRVHLPTYPFARERYWIEEVRSQELEVRNGEQRVLHPLLHENTSTLEDQQFSLAFSSNEIFPENPQVTGQQLLSLPTYPFARERNWVEEFGSQTLEFRKGEQRVLHPLLHENTSTLEDQQFSLVFSSNGIFPENPQVTGQQLLSLPTYPFARERNWINENAECLNQQSTVGYRHWLHPLLHENTSTLKEQRFSSVFDGEEFFLKDHQVQGQKVLPGVAYLEMARAAVERAVGASEDDVGVLELSNVVWSRPVVVGEESQRVDIGLYPEENGSIGWEVYTEVLGEEEPVVHSQGVASRVNAGEAPKLDVPALRLKLTEERLVEEVYAAFKKMGLNYGPGHCGLSELYVGADEALAKVNLPESVAESAGDYGLHPSLLDSALQAAISLGSQLQDKPALPFALEKLEVYSPCPKELWAWLRKAEGSTEQVRKLDIDLFDESGKVCVAMRGFSARLLEGTLDVSTELSVAVPESSVGLLALTPVWQRTTPVADDALITDSRVLVIGASEEAIPAFRVKYPCVKSLPLPKDCLSVDRWAEQLTAVAEEGAIEHIVWQFSAPSGTGLNTSLIVSQRQGVLALFSAIKALLQLGYGERPLGWTVLTTQTQSVFRDDPIDPTHAGVVGLMGSLAKEYRHWSMGVLDLPADTTVPVSDFLGLSCDDGGAVLTFREGVWFQQELAEAEVPAVKESSYRQGGVYVVLGGAGGIGQVWSRLLIEVYQARIVWLGRRAMDEEIESKCAALGKLGPEPWYIQADGSDPKALAQACARIKERYGRIDGLVHAAIVLSDQSLAQMSLEQFESGLRAKVDTSVCLAEVFGAEDLDFAVFFSSLQSFTKAPGQSNYAAGCTFKDAFAHALSRQWSCAVKIMNWGYWGSAGIVTDELYQKRMTRLGIGSIEAEEGLPALERLIGGQLDQVAFLKTLRADVLQDLSLNGLTERVTVYSRSIPEVLGVSSPLDSKAQAALSAAPRLPKGLEALLLSLLSSQLNQLGLIDDSSASASTQASIDPRYRDWLRESRAFLQSHTVSEEISTVDTEALWSEWDARSSAWREDPQFKAQVTLLDACLRALPEVLTGRCPATDILFPNSSMELVEGVYRGTAVADGFNACLVEALTGYCRERLSQAPDSPLRILEVGAGTGGTTAGLLPELEPFQDQIEEYAYTDLSKAFLLHAEAHYAKDASYLKTRLFDVSKPLASQEVPSDYYDVAIAANVLHATADIRTTLRNVKATLRSGGLLLLNELSSKSLFAHLTFGLLDGWWLYEDHELRIPGSPGLYPQGWAKVLEQEGFKQIAFPAQKYHDLGQQIVLAFSDGIVRQQEAEQSEPVKLPAQPVQTLRTDAPEASKALSVSESKASLVQHSADVTDQMLDDYVRTCIRDSVVSSLKLDGMTLRDDRSFAEYGVDSIIAVELINQINQRCNLRLQTTVLFDKSTVDQLTQHIIDTNRSELVKALSSSELGSAQVAFVSDTVAESTTAAQKSSKRVDSPEIPAGRSRRRFLPSVSIAQQESLMTESSGIYQKLLINGPGTIDDLSLTAVPVVPLQSHEVRINVRAFSLNFGDLLCVKGLYPTMPPYPFTPGFEASGTVVEVGSAVRNVQTDDAVIVVMGEQLGGHATQIICTEEQIVHKPRSLKFEQACALPAVAITMIDAFHKAQLQSGERILIQTATGGTGLIAVQLAKHYGAEIYATAGSQRKLDYLKQLGVHHVINYRATDFEAAIRELTSGKGVDVVINTLSGDALQKGINCLASGGRYIEIAMTALKSARKIDLSVINNNQSIFSVDLRKLSLEQPGKVQAYRREMLELIEDKVIKPTVGKTFTFSQFKKAYRCLEDRENIGKVVVSVPEIKTLSKPLKEVHSSSNEGTDKSSIAIIGLSGRFPGADDLDQFWENLKAGKDCIREIPKDRWDWRALYDDPNTEVGKTATKWGGFIEGAYGFDPLFFGISPREGQLMDPQQRLLMEYCWKAIEDAGINCEALSQRSTGVFIAAGMGEYRDQLTSSDDRELVITGSVPSMIPNRISYAFNLQGPSEYCETACSSVLVALHRAIHSLERGECEQAIVGGVNLLLSPRGFMGFEAMEYLSPNGKAKSFQADADGFVRSEGVGAILIKPLSQAKADRHHIYALIKGTGVAHGGKGMSLTAPNAGGMKAAMKQAYETSNVDPSTIAYIEAHGIASSLADGIEIDALQSGYRELSTRDSSAASPCYIGSLKPCIGHGEIVSGMAALFKVILAMRHRTIPGIPGFTKPNEHIALEKGHFVMTADNQPWQRLTDVSGKPLPRRAAINGYGFGGVNGHVVIEEYPEDLNSQISNLELQKGPHLIVLSAKTEERLKLMAGNLKTWLENQPEGSRHRLSDIAYTLQMGREAMEYRLAMVVSSYEALVSGLRQYMSGEGSNGIHQTIYAGNTEEDSRLMKTLLSGKAEKAVLDIFLSEGDLEKLAAYWVQGGKALWDKLPEDSSVRRVSLPTYPFAQERYWIEGEVKDVLSGGKASSEASEKVNLASLDESTLGEEITQLICDCIGIEPNSLDRKKSLQNDYGMASLSFMRLQHELSKRYSVFVKFEDFIENTRVDELIDHVKRQVGREAIDRQAVLVEPIETKHSEINTIASIQRLLLETNKVHKRFHTRTFFFKLKSEISEAFLLNLISELQERHYLLRCRYKDNQFVELAEADRNQIIKRYDLRGLPKRAKHQKLALIGIPEINLEEELPWKLALIQWTPKTVLIAFSFHHIIFDAYSLSKLPEHLMACAARNEKKLSDSSDYRNYVREEVDFLNSKVYQTSESFWRKRLSNSQVKMEYRENYYRSQGPEALRELDGHAEDELRVKELSPFVVREKSFHIANQKGREIRQCCSAFGVSESSFLQFIYTMGLLNLSRQTHISIGTLRTYPRDGSMDKTLGPFFNINVSQLTNDNPGRLIDSLKDFHRSLVQQFDHSRYPIEKILEIKRDDWGFNSNECHFYLPVMFNYLDQQLLQQNDSTRNQAGTVSLLGGQDLQMNLGGLSLSSFKPEETIQLSGADVYIFVTVVDSGIQLKLRIKDSLFNECFEEDLVKEMEALTKTLLAFVENEPTN